MADERAPLVEVFWSLQGEGRFVGQPMAFLRVATCPLRCSYCDTVHSYAAPATAPVRDGSGAELREPNPVAAPRAAELVQQVIPAGVRARAVSVTGGEPLAVPRFVRAVGERLRAAGVRLHLETAAHDAEALAQCVEAVDHLSADYKFPVTIGGQDHGEAHVRCCERALARGATVDVKLVLTPGVDDAAMATALRRLRPVRDHVVLVLQPVTPCLRETAPLSSVRLGALAAMAAGDGFDLRVLPQVHKVLQVP